MPFWRAAGPKLELCRSKRYNYEKNHISYNENTLQYQNRSIFLIDRYWAVGYPLRKRLTKSKAKVVIGIIWVSSAALAAPVLYASQIRPLPWLGEGKEGCDELWSDKERKIFTLFLLCFTYVIPVCLLMFTYFRIGRILYQRSQPDIRTHVQTKSTQKVQTYRYQFI